MLHQPNKLIGPLVYIRGQIYIIVIQMYKNP
jgi:hypothetical protein